MPDRLFVSLGILPRLMDSFHVNRTDQDGTPLVPKIRVAGGYLLQDGVLFA
jgi:hypothetical protein